MHAASYCLQSEVQLDELCCRGLRVLYPIPDPYTILFHQGGAPSPPGAACAMTHQMQEMDTWW